MKILFISANTYKDPYPIYPLGISYLKTALDNSFGADVVDIADMNFTSLDGLKDKINSCNYAHICISMRNIDNLEQWKENKFVIWYKQIVNCVREQTNTLISGGGAGYSIFPEILLKELDLDFGMKGEGEVSLTDLLKLLINKQIYTKEDLDNKFYKNKDYTIENDLCKIQGLVWRNLEGKVLLNNRDKYLTSIDLQFDKETIDFYWKQSGMLNIQTKRGCPHHCIYCSYPIIEGKVVRTLNPDKIVSVIKDLYDKYKINYFFFTDSVFNMKRSYNYELCNKLIESGVKINWGAYFAPNSELTYRDLELYKKSGLTHIEFGTESFSNTQLKNYGKNFTWEEVLEKSKMCDDLGIFYSHFMILAGYGETEATLNESYEHSKLLNNSVSFPYIGMRIYPNTRLSEIAKEEGIIKDDNDLLIPHFYISKNVDITKIEENAKKTGHNWVFPNDVSQNIIQRYRNKGMKGPLWEYLRFTKFIG